MQSSPLVDDCYCFAVRQAARKITAVYDNALAPVQLTSPQFGILALLERNPGASLQDLAAALRSDRTTTLRAVMVLEKSGLITALPRARAKEKLTLSLTPEGSARLEAAHPLWLAAQKQFEGECGEEKAGRLRASLRHL
jgi:DNA-binding MarR family transcriptional regulator